MKLDISFTNILIITSFILLILKLSNIINIDWYIVLFPMLLPIASTIFLFVAVVFIFVIILIACLVDRNNEEWLNMYLKELEKLCDKQNARKD